MRLRDLPLVSLRTFAVVADCGSVTTAAETLGVTHSAVSKQVKLLERWLGQTLFILEGRKIVLTPFGDILSGKLGSAFEDIAGACAYVQRQRERRTITVEAPATFAMYWLLPRVSAFRAKEPQTDVWVSTRMTGQSPNFAGHDLVVMRGDAAPASTRLSERVFLFREDMAVLTSPKLLARKPLGKPTDIAGHELIESMTRPQDWQAWLKRADINDAIVAGGHRFDHLFVAIQADMPDLGGRDHLQFAGAPAVENIGKAMVGFGDQQHDPLAGSAVAHPPVHFEAVRDGAESGLQSRQRDRKIGGGEYNPHEEMPGFDVIELLRVENVLPIMGEKC